MHCNMENTCVNGKWLQSSFIWLKFRPEVSDALLAVLHVEVRDHGRAPLDQGLATFAKVLLKKYSYCTFLIIKYLETTNTLSLTYS